LLSPACRLVPASKASATVERRSGFMGGSV
jgi:hypothetical protein